MNIEYISSVPLHVGSLYTFSLIFTPPVLTWASLTCICTYDCATDTQHLEAYFQVVEL